MGLRSLDIPANPQPQNIGTPIPGAPQDQGSTLGDVVKSLRPAAPQAMGGAPDPSMGSPAPSQPPPIQAPQPNDGSAAAGSDQVRSPASSPGSVPKGTKSSDEDDLLMKLAQDAQKLDKGGQAHAQAQDDDLNSLAAQVYGTRPGATQSIVPGLDPMTRFIASAGRNDFERLQILKSKLGEGNVRQTQDGTFEFRRNVNDAFRPIQGNLSLGMFLTSPGTAIKETEGRVADHGVGLLEGAGQAAVAAGVAGVAIGSGGLAAGPAAAIGDVAAPAAAAMFRKALVQGMGVEDPNYSAFSDFALNAGLNAGVLAGLGTGKLLATTLSEVNAASQLSRLNKLGLTRLAVDKVLEDARLVASGTSVTMQMAHGLQGEFSEASEEGVKTVSRKEVGVKFQDLLTQAHQNLTMAVREVDTKAIAQMGERKVPANNVIDQMEAIISREGGMKDPDTGYFKMPEGRGGVQKIVNNKMIDQDIRDEMIAQAGRTNVAFGSPNGQSMLKDLIDDHTAFLAQERAYGGTTMKELLDRTRKYENLTDYRPEMAKNSEMNKAFKDVASASIQDRNGAFQVALKGTPEAQVWESAYSNFSKKIEPLLELQTAVRNTQSSEMITDALFKPHNSELVSKVKAVLGEDSSEWQQLRANFVMDKVQSSVTRQGIFDGGKFLESTSEDALGKDFLDQIGGREVINRLRAVARVADTIQTTDLIRPKTRNSLVTMVTAATSLITNPIWGSKLLFKMTLGNKQATDYLLDQGFMEAVSLADSNEKKSAIHEMARITQNIVANSKVANINGVKRYIPVLVGTSAALGTALNSTGAAKDAQQMIQSTIQEPPAAPPAPDTSAAPYNPPGE